MGNALSGLLDDYVRTVSTGDKESIKILERRMELKNTAMEGGWYRKSIGGKIILNMKICYFFLFSPPINTYWIILAPIFNAF